jgi:TRAP-type mannitol/chloroaromatic compound transport system permease small subunit
MPSLTFVLPHWLYWAGLIALPLIAMYLTRRQIQEKRSRISLGIAYLMWITGGFVGLHRFYLRSAYGLIFIPLFIGILYANTHQRDARNAVSAAQNEISVAEFMLERAASQSEDKRRVAEAELTRVEQLAETSEAELAFWGNTAMGFAIAIALLLVIDALLLPRLARLCAEREPAHEVEDAADWTHAQAEVHHDPSYRVHTRVTDWVDRTNERIGEFVAFWSIIAVFVYYYEVLARYVFNSPTNWAHEGMFLMFGMQYLIAGGFALREDAHVRVDVVYLLFSDKVKAIVDVVTSVFFFIFTGTLLWTGWVFFMDSYSVSDVSFTEWAIQYWPVKLAIPVGAALLLLQGLAKLSKDLVLVRQHFGAADRGV